MSNKCAQWSWTAWEAGEKSRKYRGYAGHLNWKIKWKETKIKIKKSKRMGKRKRKSPGRAGEDFLCLWQLLNMKMSFSFSPLLLEWFLCQAGEASQDKAESNKNNNKISAISNQWRQILAYCVQAREPRLESQTLKAQKHWFILRWAIININVKHRTDLLERGTAGASPGHWPLADCQMEWPREWPKRTIGYAFDNRKLAQTMILTKR